MNKIYPLGLLLTIGIIFSTNASWAQWTGFGSNDGSNRFRVGPNGAEGRFNDGRGQTRVDAGGNVNYRGDGFRFGGNIGDVFNGDFSGVNFGWGNQGFGGGVEHSAGDTGAQYRLTNPTGKQADKANEFFPDVRMAPTWTGEMAHRSVNRAAIPDGGYTCGFGQGATFPQQSIGGVDYIWARSGQGERGNYDYNTGGGRGGGGGLFNFGWGPDGWSVGGSAPIPGMGGGGFPFNF